LREVAENLGVAAYMVDSANEIDALWLKGKTRIGITAGASAPEILVQNLLRRLEALGISDTTLLSGAIELVSFPMPKGLEHKSN